MTILRNFHSCSSNRRDSICLMMLRWIKTYEKFWEYFTHLFTFQPIFTIQKNLSRIRLNCSNSKHCQIFWCSASNNILTLLFSSLTREDNFITIGETSQTFDDATSLKPVLSSRLVSLIDLSQRDKAFSRFWEILKATRRIDEIRFVLWCVGGKEHMRRFGKVSNTYWHFNQF